MDVATGCGCKEIYFLILLIPTPLVSVLFCSSIPTFCSFKKMFFVLVIIIGAKTTMCKLKGGVRLMKSTLFTHTQ